VDKTHCILFTMLLHQREVLTSPGLIAELSIELAYLMALTSSFEINMTHCTIGAQDNNNHQRMNIPIATVESVIITKHCVILAIIHQHGYHPTVGISIHCKVPFKWCKDFAPNLAMTAGTQPFLPVFSSSLNVCDQTPAGASAMVTKGSYLDLLGREHSASHLLWPPVTSVVAGQEPNKVHPLSMHIMIGHLSSFSSHWLHLPWVPVLLTGLLLYLILVHLYPLTLGYCLSILTRKQSLTLAIGNIGNHIGLCSIACGRTPTTLEEDQEDLANFITLSGFGIFHDPLSGLETELDGNLMDAVLYVLTSGDNISLESLSASLHSWNKFMMPESNSSVKSHSFCQC